MQAHVRNRVFITLLVATNSLGNLFVAIGVRTMPSFDPANILSYAASVATDFWMIAGVALLILWMVAQLSMFTWADLSYVLPVTASAYLLTAIFGKVFLNDRITVERWVGIAFISAGVMLVSATPASTREHPAETESE